MAKKKNKNNIIIMIALLGVIYLFANNMQLFSVAEGVAGGRHDAACTFITNAPAGSTYGNDGLWVSTDITGDGNKEAMGWYSSMRGLRCSQEMMTFHGTSPEGFAMCGHTSLVANTTTSWLYIEISNETLNSAFPQTRAFYSLEPEATNAITTCAVIRVCTQEVKQCSDGTYVSRNADNNCSFNECPNNPLESKCTSTNGTILQTFAGPAECKCPEGNRVMNSTFTGCTGVTSSECLFQIETFCVKTWMVLVAIILLMLLFLMAKK
jgi:hypothetical protein